MPPKKLRGMLMTSAQGQLTTRKVRARCSHMVQGPPRKKLGRIASASASPQTVGVYHRANLVMKFSALAFLLLEFSTRSRILATVDWP